MGAEVVACEPEGDESAILPTREWRMFQIACLVALLVVWAGVELFAWGRS